MVVCLIFKVYKPLLGLAVDLDRNNDRAGIDLIGFLLVLQLALPLNLRIAISARSIRQTNLSSRPLKFLMRCQVFS